MSLTPAYTIDNKVRVESLSSQEQPDDFRLVGVDGDGNPVGDEDLTRSNIAEATRGRNVPLFSVWTQPPLNMKGSDGAGLTTLLAGWTTAKASDDEYPREARRTEFFQREGSGLNPLTGTWTVPRNGTYRIDCFVSTMTRKPGGSPNGLGFLPTDALWSLQGAAFAAEAWILYETILVYGEFAAIAVPVFATYPMVGLLNALGVVFDITGVLAAVGIIFHVLAAIAVIAEVLVITSWILSFIGVTPPDDPGRIGAFIVVNNIITAGNFRNNCLVGSVDPNGIYDEKHLSTDMRLNAGDKIQFYLGHTGTDGIDGLSARWAVTQTYDFEEERNDSPTADYNVVPSNQPPFAFRQAPRPTELSGMTALYGTAAAITGDSIYSAVSAPGHGSVYVYKQRQGVWWPHQTIDKPSTSGSTFGASLAFSRADYTLVVGDPGEDQVLVYRRDETDDFVLVDTILPEGNTGAASFGASVAVSSDGSHIACGAPGDDGGRGSLWVYRETADNRGYWGRVLGPVAHADASSGDGCSFGASVDIAADGALVVASGPGLGRVCAWSATEIETQWNLEPSIAPQGTMSAGYGAALSLDAPGTNLFVVDRRAGNVGVHHFKRNSYYSAYGEPRRFFPASQFERDPGAEWSITPSAQFGGAIVASDDGHGFMVSDPGTATVFSMVQARRSVDSNKVDWVAWLPLTAAPHGANSLSGASSLAASGKLYGVILGGRLHDSSAGGAWMA
ncbi:hypothetical protein QKT49_gp292 [Acanthamoeba castellanii medusavirus]|uniref:Uncharacterized protein n=1 Tax=Acanthamoeba castellanii medusavirus J1 TaxID=3114988 RepID=A0A3T1CXC5_9VIRU|nr:hypothetical protein QKT49_gp292 [Acanthamoeba castellanii medusavirus]BBI30471.1 hypothetical protein [Acanthamoeba castellanii medusavirus J1]